MKNKTTWIIVTIMIVVVFLILSFFMPSIIQCFYLMGQGKSKVLSASFNPSDILTFWGSSLGALATVLLGALALYQNKTFKEENDKSQDKLNGAVEKLAEANNIIAATNAKLLTLEEKGQKIQLLLAQKFIPFLELDKLEIKSTVPCETPITSKFAIKQNGSINNNILHEGKKFRQILFDVEAISKITPGHYLSLKFEMDLLHQAEAKISSVDILSIKLGSPPTEEIFDKQGLNTELEAVNFLFSEWAVYNINLILSEDSYNVVQVGTFNFTLELIITITTGISYKETIKANILDFPQTKKVVYMLEPQ